MNIILELSVLNISCGVLLGGQSVQLSMLEQMVKKVQLLVRLTKHKLFEMFRMGKSLLMKNLQLSK